MRKGFLVKLGSVFTAALILSACSTGGFTGLKLDKAYALSTEITKGDTRISADFERFSEGRWNVTLTEPYELQGVVLYYMDGKVKASYAGITIDITDVPEVSALADKIVYSIESAIKGEGTETVKSGDKIRVSGNCQFGSYTLILDGKTKLPLSAELPDQSISVRFTNASASNTSEPEAVAGA